MARFLAEVEGNRKPVHRLGSPNSGIRAQAQGWKVGVKIYGNPKPLDPENDMFEIYVTSGSHDTGRTFKLGTVQRTSNNRTIFQFSDELTERTDPTYQSVDCDLG